MTAVDQIRQIFQRVLAHDEEYWLDDKYVRWGKLERDICSVVDNTIEEVHQASREWDHIIEEAKCCNPEIK